MVCLNTVITIPTACMHACFFYSNGISLIIAGWKRISWYQISCNYLYQIISSSDQSSPHGLVRFLKFHYGILTEFFHLDSHFFVPPFCPYLGWIMRFSKCQEFSGFKFSWFDKWLANLFWGTAALSWSNKVICLSKLFVCSYSSIGNLFFLLSVQFFCMHW